VLVWAKAAARRGQGWAGEIVARAGGDQSALTAEEATRELGTTVLKMFLKIMFPRSARLLF
jgi:hypothetical protein